MLRIITFNNAAAAKDYFTRSLSQDYYCKETAQEVLGHWGGKGADRLNLNGPVTFDAFAALCQNQHPETGATLTCRNRSVRRVAFDIGFSVPKSVSVVYELTGDDRILDAFRTAVQTTLCEMETTLRTRIRTDGRNDERTTGEAIWGEFYHKTARPINGLPDPQLHCHAVWINATYCDHEARWKAADLIAIKQSAPYHEAAFHHRMASALQTLGYGITRTRDRYEITGVPATVITKFSRRTATIEHAAAERGITSAAAKDKLGGLTRQGKADQRSMTELRHAWHQRLTSEESHALTTLRNGERPVGWSATQAATQACDQLFERSAVVPESKLLAATLRYGIGGASIPALRAALTDHGVLTRDVNGQRFATTRAMLAAENHLIALAQAGKGQLRPIANPATYQHPQLGPDQLAAVRHVLGSNDWVTLIRGAAGTGKTTAMQAAREALADHGLRVFAFAGSAAASRGVLREAGFSTATTVAQLLVDRPLQDAAHGQVIWIDEAGQLSTRDLVAVLTLSRQLHARLVLQGDARQHGSVAAGDAFRTLQKFAGLHFAEISTIRRQSGPYRDAVAALSRGDVVEGFDRLDALGAIHVLTDDERYHAVATAYVAAHQRGQSVLAISPTHVEADRTSAVIRAQLQQAGRLGRREIEWVRLVAASPTEAERRDALYYQTGDIVEFERKGQFPRGTRATVIGRDSAGNVLVEHYPGEPVPLRLQAAATFQVYRPAPLRLAAGDRITIRKNGHALDGSALTNGASHVVKGFSSTGDLQLTDGRMIARQYGHLAHGYVATSHASQGKTYQVVLVAQSAASWGATSDQQFYVSVSRGKQSCHIFTDDKAALREAVQRSGERMAARELMTPSETTSQAHAGVIARLARQAAAYASQTTAAVRKQLARVHEKRPVPQVSPTL